MEREYYHQTLYQPSLQGHSKPFYSLLTRKNGKCSHTLLSMTEQETVSDKANHFYSYFHGVFSKFYTACRRDFNSNGTTVAVTIECFPN